MGRMVFLVFALALFPVASLRAEPTSQPTAESLMRAVKESEQWIDHVDSFYARFEGGWRRTPAGRKRRLAELKKQFPSTQITEDHFHELRPYIAETLIIAFDAHRIYKDDDRQNDSIDTRIFDGERVLTYSKYFGFNQEGYGISNDPRRAFRYLFSDLSWLRADDHSFWWNPHKPWRGYRFDQEGAQVWHIAGREAFRGVECYVLEKEYGWTKWYVGVDRPLLHGLISYVSSRAEDAKAEKARDAVNRKYGVPKGLKGFQARQAWEETLPPERLAAYRRESARAGLKYASLLAVHYLLDYKEIAPGKWFPMTQGYEIWNGDQLPAILESTREFKTVEVRINQPLPDKLFKMEMTEGVEVYDATYDPPLRYKYKKHFEPAEWQKIVDQAKEREKFWADQKKAQEAIIGKPAPAFPEKSQWINSDKPLTWEALRGKVVLIDFFADWCGPCRNDLPMMAQLHQDRKSNHFVVMAIHPPGSKRASIDKVIKEFKLTYPICIDVPPPRGAEAWGKLYAQYKVKAIPHAVVVDKNGNVAGQGSLGEMVALAHKLGEQ